MAIAQISQVQGRPSGTTGDTFTTSSIDTTGANFLYASIQVYAGAPGYSAPTISDSKGNTWTALTFYSTGASNYGSVRSWYCENATTGTGHTFTFTGTDFYGPGEAKAFSGVATSSALDQQTGVANTSSSTTHQPGSLTPSVNDCLIISSIQTNSANITSINSSFQAVDTTATSGNTTNWINGQIVSGGTSYLIQTTATAVNPTWTIQSSYACLNLAVFKPAGGSSTQISSINGVAQASISSFNGVALASIASANGVANS